MSAAVASAFQYDKLVLAAPTYDAGIFPPMEDFLLHLKSKTFQNRDVAVIENGSWAITAGKLMTGYVEGFKGCTVKRMVTVKSAMKDSTVTELEALADALYA